MSSEITTAPPALYDDIEIVRALRLIGEEGHPVEVRILEPKKAGWSPRVISGYFTDPEIVPRELRKLNLLGAKGFYLTLNRLSGDLAARSHNHFTDGKDDGTTKDPHVVRRRWLPLDFDPKRATGISSSEEEKAAAKTAMKAVYLRLKNAGWPEPIAADSGNGFHLLYRVDLPTESDIVPRCLAALSEEFSTDAVDVDTTTGNPARIFKLYGTLAAKGDHCPELGRPWRMSRILHAPEELVPVPVELLELLAGPVEIEADTPNRDAGSSERKQRGAWDKARVQAFIDKHLSDCSPRPPVAYSGGWKWVLGSCPFDPSHTNGSAAVFIHADGKIGYRCQHNSCSGIGWKELREKFDPKDKRAVTSPQNGKQGGREKVPYAEIAKEFAETRRDPVEGVFLLRYHRGQWWEYDGWCYRPAQKDDVAAAVMAFLHDDHPDNATTNCVDNILANLRAFDLCGTHSRQQPPLFIDSDESGAGWCGMGSRLVNVERLARFVGGEDLPERDIFRPKTPRLFSHFALPYEFDPEATCPIWLKYLEGVQPDEKDRRVLQMLCGLALVPLTHYNVAFFLFGDGGCGKSVFLHVLRHLVGEENVCCLPIIKLSDRFTTWQLTTHLLNIVGDGATADERHNLRDVEGTFKDVTDGGLVACEHKYGEPGEAPAIARSIFATNSLPRFHDRTQAMWDRLRIIPFDQRFRGTAQDNPKLRHEIVAGELPGVFVWAVEGLAMLLREKWFPEHSRGMAAKEEHRSACDVAGTYLRDNYVRGGVDSYIEAATMYGDYRAWMHGNGHQAGSSTTFAADVQRVFNSQKIQRRIDAVTRSWVFPGIEAAHRKTGK